MVSTEHIGEVYNDDNNDGTLTFATVGSLFFKGIDYCSHYYKSSKNGQSNRFERRRERDFAAETTVNYVMAPSHTQSLFYMTSIFSLSHSDWLLI